jgi:hypothetical protein
VDIEFFVINGGAFFLFTRSAFIYKKLCNFNGRNNLMRKTFLFLLVLFLLIGKAAAQMLPTRQKINEI